MIKKIFTGTLYVVGIYVGVVVILKIAAAFGYETARGKEQREQLRTYYDGHKQLYCKKTAIAPTSLRCTQEFDKSDYKKSVTTELARVKSAQDKEEARITPLWRRIFNKLIQPFQ